jgi:hypothetical protein
MFAQAAGASAPRAVWVWEEDTFHFLEDKHFQQGTEAFLDEHHISTVYLYADDC